MESPGIIPSGNCGVENVHIVSCMSGSYALFQEENIVHKTTTECIIAVNKLFNFGIRGYIAEP